VSRWRGGDDWGEKRKSKKRELSGKIKNWKLKGWDGEKEVWMEVGRIGNWNPEKANFPSLDAFAFTTTPRTLLHHPLRVVITLGAV
jgi:hypothetical protein